MDFAFSLTQRQPLLGGRGHIGAFVITRSSFRDRLGPLEILWDLVRGRFIEGGLRWGGAEGLPLHGWTLQPCRREQADSEDLLRPWLTDRKDQRNRRRRVLSGGRGKGRNHGSELLQTEVSLHSVHPARALHRARDRLRHLRAGGGGERQELCANLLQDTKPRQGFHVSNFLPFPQAERILGLF